MKVSASYRGDYRRYAIENLTWSKHIALAKPVYYPPVGSPQIQSQGWKRKSADYITIALCGCLCLYYISGCVDKYFSYPTRVSVKVKELKTLQDGLPGVTVCTNDRVSLEKLSANDEDEERETYLKAKKILRSDQSEAEKFEMREAILTPRYQNYIKNVRLKDSFNYTAKVKDLVEELNCDYESWSNEGGRKSMSGLCDDIYKVRSVENDGACFTMFHESAIRARMLDFVDPEVTKKLAVADVNLGGGQEMKAYKANQILELRLRFPKKYKFDLRTPNGGKIMIHANREIPTTTSMAFHVRPGHIYSFYIKRHQTTRLPPPYETMCWNYTDQYYTAMAKSNVSIDVFFPMSRQSCIDFCIASYILETCKCWPNSIPYLRDNRTGIMYEYDKCQRKEENTCSRFASEKCADKCPADCIEDQYDMRLEEELDPSSFLIERHKSIIRNPSKLMNKDSSSTFIDELDDLKEKAIIRIIYATTEMSVHSHEASYEFEEALCEIGGLIGMFIGISVITMYDFLEQISFLVYRRSFSSLAP